MREVAVVGGGAAGFAAAITAARGGNVSVTVYERLQKPLKKLLATGNGRCNLTNLEASAAAYRGDPQFAEPALTRFSPAHTLRFFRSMGLCTKTEALGRVYPMSGQAASVRDVLLEEARRLSVHVCTDCAIETVRPENDGFLLNGVYRCDALVLAAGGAAAPQHGTDGGAFRLLEQLGLPVIRPFPALTALVCRKFPKNLKGVRCDCGVRLYDGERLVYETAGEVQFTEYGLSGIPVFSLSRYASGAANAAVALNCLPQLSAQTVAAFLCEAARKTPEKPAGLLAEGLVPQALGSYLLLQCGIRKEEKIGALQKKRLLRFGETLQDARFAVEGPRGFDFAQVTAGGADCASFSPATMEAKRYPHLFVCGETLNVDGDCGGYNLQWAWSSGCAAGEAIAQWAKKEGAACCASGN